MFRLDYLLIADYSLLQVKRKLGVKKIYNLAIALMSGVILTACVGAVNIGGGNSPEFALINRCIVGNTAQADPTCAKAVTDTNGCITDPFSSGCEVNPVFSPHVQNARDERAKFCDNTDNSKDSLCTGSDSVKDICTHNPFITLCEKGYDSKRREVVESCTEGNNANDRSCKNAVIAHPCITNPLGKGCGTDEDFMRYIETAVTNRASFCSDSKNSGDSLCMDFLACQSVSLGVSCLVNTSDITLELDNAPNTNGVVILKHDFLNLTDNKISTAGFTDFTTPATICTQDGCALQSAGAVVVGDGYAYYIANDANGNPKYSYAGILNTTNLGLPLYSFTSPTATWRGEWSLNGDAPDTSSEADDLVLEINYKEQKLNGRGEKMIGGVMHEIMVSGNYNESGAILAGEADLMRSTVLYNGVLIGLIGQKGAVGAFRSSDSGVSFAGGFVVRPPSE